jgi:hypothetical protein
MYRSTFSWPRHLLEVSGLLHAPDAWPPGKSPRYPFYRRLGGPQSRSGRYGEVKIFYLTGTWTPASPGRPACSQSLYRLSYPVTVKNFLHVIQTGSGAPPASYPMRTGGGGFPPGVRRPVREADHSPPTSTEVKKMNLYIHSPIRLHGVGLN